MPQNQELTDFIKDIKKRIARAGSIPAIIDLINETNDFLDDAHFEVEKDSLTQFANKLSHLSTQSMNHIIGNSELELGRSRIVHSFLGLLTQLKKSPKSNTKPTSNPTIQKKNKLKVFLSYAHKDAELKNQLDIHLAPLRRSNQIEIWQDGDILAGNLWDDDIKSALLDADIVLLLISASFIASDYIWDEELPLAIERHKAGKTKIVPIFLKPCNWKSMPFAGFQGLPRGAKPISSAVDIDEALMQVSVGIEQLVTHLLNKK